jgi:thiamine pyrophosphate-dependent acetolactate synthase large subunit-like protein
MTIEPMLTEEMPASALVARVLEEAGIEMVFGISGGHTGRIVQGLSKYQNSIRTVPALREALAARTPTVIDVMTSLEVTFADITSQLAKDASPRRR